MEPATIAVLVITAAFLGFCIWIERHSRSQERPSQSSESVYDRSEVLETADRTQTAEELRKRSSTSRRPPVARRPATPR